MTYRFTVRGRRVRHSWQKDCPSQAAIMHANSVARECAKDLAYDDAMIEIIDDTELPVATVTIPRVDTL